MKSPLTTVWYHHLWWFNRNPTGAHQSVRVPVSVQTIDGNYEKRRLYHCDNFFGGPGQGHRAVDSCSCAKPVPGREAEGDYGHALEGAQGCNAEALEVDTAKLDIVSRDACMIN